MTGTIDAMEQRLLPSGLIGVWDLSFAGPSSTTPEQYELKLTEKGEHSKIELPGWGKVRLKKVKIDDLEFHAKFFLKGITGEIEGTGTNPDETGKPQELTIRVTMEGALNQELDLVNTGYHPEVTRDNELLRQQILFEVPELGKTLAAGEKLEAAELILGWAARTGDFALDGTTVGLTSNATSVADLYYNYLDPDVVGMSCGGYGNYYSSLLKLYNIDSLDVGFGELPILTHTTVVIPIQKKGTWKFYLMDPTFGTTFINPETHQKATFFDLIDFENAGKLDKLIEQQVPLDQREFLSPIPLLRPELIYQDISSDNFVYHWENYGLTSYFAGWGELMNNSGYSADLHGFVGMIKNRIYNVLTYGNQISMSAARTAFINEANSRGIPFGF